MIQNWPKPIILVVMFSVFLLNLIFWATPVYIIILFKIFTPKGRARDALARLMADVAQRWAGVNIWLINTLLTPKWVVTGDTKLSRSGQYLVCANHQSWNDIIVLMKTFGRDAPFFKFFLKQELIWVPILGLAWWGLDFPFMKRFSREQVEKNPELRGKDLETTRKACEKYENQPVMLLNFLEGTRYTKEKSEKQNSPYRYLLKPKAGGFAFTLGAMGEKLNSLMDVTIVYGEGPVGFWAFLAGEMRTVYIDVRKLTVPADLYGGDYQDDLEYRQRMQDWVHKLWLEKDQRIAEIRQKAGIADSA